MIRSYLVVAGTGVSTERAALDKSLTLQWGRGSRAAAAAALANPAIQGLCEGLGEREAFARTRQNDSRQMFGHKSRFIKDLQSRERAPHPHSPPPRSRHRQWPPVG